MVERSGGNGGRWRARVKLPHPVPLLRVRRLQLHLLQLLPGVHYQQVEPPQAHLELLPAPQPVAEEEPIHERPSPARPSGVRQPERREPEVPLVTPAVAPSPAPESPSPAASDVPSPEPVRSLRREPAWTAPGALGLPGQVPLSPKDPRQAPRPAQRVAPTRDRPRDPDLSSFTLVRPGPDGRSWVGVRVVEALVGVTSAFRDAPGGRRSDGGRRGWAGPGAAGACYGFGKRRRNRPWTPKVVKR